MAHKKYPFEKRKAVKKKPRAEKGHVKKGAIEGKKGARKKKHKGNTLLFLPKKSGPFIRISLFVFAVFFPVKNNLVQKKNKKVSVEVTPRNSKRVPVKNISPAKDYTKINSRRWMATFLRKLILCF